jgi:hypothetical protein
MVRLPVYSAGQCRTLYAGFSISYSSIVHFIGPYRTLLYFPMQKVLKIRLRMSSVVVAPVISSSGRRAP